MISTRTVRKGALVLGLLGAAATAASPALAADKADANRRATAFQAVLDCRKETDDQARLKCYDAAAQGMEQAATKGEIVVVDKAQATQAHREAFGLPIPSLNFLDKALKPEEVDTLDGVVKTARLDAHGRLWTFTLEDGAIWRQIAGDPPNRDPHPGSKVRIRKGAIGSFLMNVDGQQAIKVHRDQ